MIRDSATFVKGVLLAITFLVVLVLMFLPLFDGENALKAADRLFNSISKDSSMYIPSLEKRNQAFKGTDVTVNVKMKDVSQSERATKLLTAAGATVSKEADQLKVSGNLGAILASALADSTLLYFNKDTELMNKYAFPGREVIYIWWNVLKEFDKDLKRQTKFKEAAFVNDVVRRGVEVAFNFFGIVPKSAIENALVLTGALVFYVIYTLWWGIAILLIFEGIGLEMKAGAKKEV